MAPPRKVRFNAETIQEADKNMKKRSAVSSDEDEDPYEQESKIKYAKKARRGISDYDGEEDDGPTEISNTTSLEAEGISIEPFHMKNENTDGTGYFDGDTYVFRKQIEEEPDAWLDQIDQDGGGKDSSNTLYDPSKVRKQADKQFASKPFLSEEDLFAKIRPCLATDKETIMEAIARYGTLLNAGPPKSRQLAKEAFDSLTEAASDLMLRGKINVYQMKRSDLGSTVSSNAPESMAPGRTASNSPANTNIQWEYKGSADGQVHGPYDTSQMLSWIQAGYFVGPSAVQVRTVEKSDGPVEAVQEPPKNTKDDLLSDLLDEDDDADERKSSNKHGEGISCSIRGEWLMSDEIDFSEYQ